MTAELRRGLMLAGVGLAGGFALVVALFGPGELSKRAASVMSPAEAPRPLAGDPGQVNRGTQSPEAGMQAGRTPSPKPGTTDSIETLPDIGAAKPPAEEAAKSAATAGLDMPSLDIVRVEPNGESVIAGRAAPNATIEILRDDKPFARATADPSGQFAIVPPTLPTGNSEIGFRALAPDGKETRGRESVAIVVAENRATKPLVALSTPDQPTRVLSQPDAPAAAAPDAKPPLAAKAPDGSLGETSGGKPPQRLSALSEPKAKTGGSAEGAPVKIVSIDAQEGGRLDVTSSAKPGATLRLYLNDTLVASGKAGPDGRLAFTIGRGVRVGGYQVRVDQVEPGSGKVEHRAQVAFAFPEAASGRVAGREAPATAVPPPIPGRPDAGKRPPGGLPPPKSPAPQDIASAPPPSAPAAEARTGNARPDAGTPSATGATAAANPATAPPKLASRPQAEAALDKLPAMAQPATPALPENKAARPVPETPAIAAAQKPDAAPSPEADWRTAEALAPKLPPAAGPQAQAASPAVALPPAAVGMKADETPAPDTMAAAEPSPGLPEASPLERPGTVFVPEISTARITRGDNLWQISRRSYGNGLRYTVIFDANKDQIKDPDLIYPGQIFVLPKDAPAPKPG